MIAARIAAVRERVAAACDRSGRSPQEVELIAVSKAFGAPAIAEAWGAGQLAFGENYVQHWQDKADDARLQRLEGLRWHFIGSLQRNKIRLLLGRVACIETVDRLRLARELSRRAMEHGRPEAVLLQVNIGREPSKSGFLPDALLSSFLELRGLPGLSIDGLMAIPPRRETPTATRADHAALRQLRDELCSTHDVELPTLSMGMSSDFEVAIEEGATRVRVGTAIFGERVAR